MEIHLTDKRCNVLIGFLADAVTEVSRGGRATNANYCNSGRVSGGVAAYKSQFFSLIQSKKDVRTC